MQDDLVCALSNGEASDIITLSSDILKFVC
jgi:hypothetical protein